jgi:hypothetical protein
MLLFKAHIYISHAHTVVLFSQTVLINERGLQKNLNCIHEEVGYMRGKGAPINLHFKKCTNANSNTNILYRHCGRKFAVDKVQYFLRSNTHAATPIHINALYTRRESTKEAAVPRWEIYLLASQFNVTGKFATRDEKQRMRAPLYFRISRNT